MTDNDRFRILIRKFACGVVMAKRRNLIPVIDTWGLKLVGGVYKIGQIRPPYYCDCHPLAMMLEDTRIFDSLCHKEINHQGHAQAPSTYHQIELMLGFKRNILARAFADGLVNNESYRNIYMSSEYPVSFAVAFELGRYLLHTHFGVRLPYRMSMIEHLL